jgi:hypothetical protein
MNKSLMTRLEKLEDRHGVDESAPDFHYQRVLRLGKVIKCIGQEEADRLKAEDPERFVIYHTIVDPAEKRGIGWKNKLLKRNDRSEAA